MSKLKKEIEHILRGWDKKTAYDDPIRYVLTNHETGELSHMGEELVNALAGIAEIHAARKANDARIEARRKQ